MSDELDAALQRLRSAISAIATKNETVETASIEAALVVDLDIANGHETWTSPTTSYPPEPTDTFAIGQPDPPARKTETQVSWWARTLSSIWPFRSANS